MVNLIATNFSCEFLHCCTLRVDSSYSRASSVWPLSLLYTVVWAVNHPWTVSSIWEVNLCVMSCLLREVVLSLTMLCIPVRGWFISRKMIHNPAKIDVIFDHDTLPAHACLTVVNHPWTHTSIWEVIRCVMTCCLREVVLSLLVLGNTEYGQKYKCSD